MVTAKNSVRMSCPNCLKSSHSIHLAMREDLLKAPGRVLLLQADVSPARVSDDQNSPSLEQKPELRFRM